MAFNLQGILVLCKGYKETLENKRAKKEQVTEENVSEWMMWVPLTCMNMKKEDTSDIGD